MTAQYRRAMIGSVQEVLVEEPADGGYTGHAPNYVRVTVPGCEDLHNQVRRVRITGVSDGAGVRGELTEE